jgi:outer membrane protein TolC
MQSSRSLIVLGIGTAVAVGSVGAAPGQAAPLASHRYADAAVGSPTSEKLTEQSAKAAKSEPSAQPEKPAQPEPSAQLKQSPEPFVVSVQSVQDPDMSPQGTASQKPTLEAKPSSAQPLVQFSSSRAEGNQSEAIGSEAIAAQPKPSESPAPAAPTPAEPTATTVPATAPAAPEPPAASAAQPSGTPATPNAAPSANPPNMEFSPAAPSTPAAPVIPTRAETSNEPAPDYLNPDPNPLSFPTRPEEVQIAGTQPITLKQAIELAIRNTRSLQEARLNVENAQAQLREAQAQNFPTLSLSSGLAFQAQQQGTPTQNLQTGATTGFDGTTFPNSTSLNATVDASYSLFTSGVRSAAIQAAREQVTFQQLQLESTTEQLILDVTNNYYALQNADEQVRIAQDSVTQAQQSLRDSQALERAGVGTRFDVLQSQVDLANSQQTLTQNISNQQVAQRQLVQQLALSQSVNVTAADPIEPAGAWTLTLEDTIVLAFKNRAELEQLLVQRDIAEQNRRQALGSIRPQITATASYGVNRTLDNSTSAPFFDGFLANFQAQLGLRWSIFDGGAARAQANQAKINGAIAENRFAEQREQIRFNVEQGYSVLQSSYSNIQVTTLAVQQAQEALRLARLRFQAGVGTQTDVLQQQTALTQAEVNRLTAILNYNRALATLNREVSNYPGGNLADTP